MLNILWKIIRFPVRHFLISGAVFGYWVCTADGGEFEFSLWMFSLCLYAAFVGPFGMIMKRREIRKKEMDYLARRIAEENSRVGNFHQGNSGSSSKSDYWLNNAMEKQEVRFQNSMPPVKGEAVPHKQTFKERWNESRGLSPTGWKFNEETGLWESPEQQKQKK